MEQTAQQKIYYTLRMAMAMCFIGHGCFGILTKQIWCNYFGVFGIDNSMAYKLMPPLGILDIILGVIILIYPIRAVVLWLMVWGVITALLRPLSGEPFAEFIERAGNYGAPLAMLMLTGFRFKNLFIHIPGPKAGTNLKQATVCLRIIVFLILAGHGWLNLIEKKALLDQYALLGFADPARAALTVGMLEIAAAFVVLVRPVAWFLLIILIWKTGSELFYPHYEVFEWIERGGSYGSILALYFATSKNAFSIRIPKINISLLNR
ncbi:MAG: hypothetical protein H0X41_10740 [Chitinophagaceae bacterium]|nr:hypothetical protein [Chitinophagaceae bacterium]